MFHSSLENRDTPIARDLKVGLSRLMEGGALSTEEAHLAFLALSAALGHRNFIEIARAKLAILDLTPEQIQEAAESAAIMGMLNTYYHFKHVVAHQGGAEMQAAYQPAGLRMTSLAKPLLGKERFEMLAFAVSVLNGCESCIPAHEKVLREAGVDAAKIHDLARMASVLKGLHSLEFS